MGEEPTGLYFTPGHHQDAAAEVEWARTHPAQLEAMGRANRARLPIQGDSRGPVISDTAPASHGALPV